MNNSIRGLIFSALFAAIIIAVSFLRIVIPFSPVPITFTQIGIMLAATVLGAYYGTLSVLIVLLLVAAGFPVLGGRGGLSMLVGPSAGFIIAWPISALVLGYITQKVKKNKYTFIKVLSLNFLIGSLLLYPTGIGWLAYKTGITSFSKALAVGLWPFMIGDFLKAMIAASITVSVWKVFPIEKILGINRTSPDPIPELSIEAEKL